MSTLSRKRCFVRWISEIISVVVRLFWLLLVWFDLHVGNFLSFCSLYQCPGVTLNSSGTPMPLRRCCRYTCIYFKAIRNSAPVPMAACIPQGETQIYIWNCLDIFGTGEIQPNWKLKNKMISKFLGPRKLEIILVLGENHRGPVDAHENTTGKQGRTTRGHHGKGKKMVRWGAEFISKVPWMFF